MGWIQGILAEKSAGWFTVPTFFLHHCEPTVP